MTSEVSWVEKRLCGDGLPIVIDGGMGTELEKSGVPMDGKVWSARAIMSHPQVVRQVHERFIEAGAEVVITNTFSTARHMLEPGGLGHEVRKINAKAVSLAKQARDAVAQHPVAIVGSICEWTHDDDPTWNSPDAVGRATKEQAEILAESGVDIIALEMCERLELSEAVASAVTGLGLPVWIGVSACAHKDHDSLSSFSYADRDFENLVKVLCKYSPSLMNVMHTAVPDVGAATDVVKKYWNGPIGVYPESGYFSMPNWNFVEIIEPAELAEQARQWLANGVRLLGGCCGLGPGHIQALRDVVSANT
jgi:homocysteine S-methyltransferase